MDRLTARQLYDSVHERMALRWVSGMRGESRVLEQAALGPQVLEPLGFEPVLEKRRVHRGRAVRVQFSCLAQNSASGKSGDTKALIIGIINTDKSLLSLFRTILN